MPHPTPFHAEQWADLLDPPALAALNAMDPDGVSGLVMRVLRVFVQSLPRYIEQMEQARRDQDVVSAKRAAHSVKSSAATIGAQFLGMVSHSAEQRCAEGQPWADSSEVSTFLAEGRRLHAALSARMPPVADTF